MALTDHECHKRWGNGYIFHLDKSCGFLRISADLSWTGVGAGLGDREQVRLMNQLRFLKQYVRRRAGQLLRGLAVSSLIVGQVAWPLETRAKETTTLGLPASQTERGDDQSVRADRLLQQAFWATLQGDAPQTVRLLERSLALRRVSSDRIGEGISLYLLGAHHLIQGFPQKSLGYSQQALEIFAAEDFISGEGLSWVSIGAVHWYQGDLEQALRAYEQAMATYSEEPERTLTLPEFAIAVLNGEGDGFAPRQLMALTHRHWGPALTQASLGGVYRDLGQPELGLAQFEEMLQRAEAAEPPHVEAKIDALKGIGSVYLMGQLQPETIPLRAHSDLLTAADSDSALIAQVADPQATEPQFNELLLGPSLISALVQAQDDEVDPNGALIGQIHTAEAEPDLFTRQQASTALRYFEQAYALEQQAAQSAVSLLGIAELDFFWRNFRGPDARWYLSLAHRKLGHYEQSLDFGQAYLSDIQTLRRGENSLHEAQALHSLGFTYEQMGQHDLALRHYRQAIPIYRQRGLPVGEAFVMRNLGGIVAEQGSPELGIAFQKRAVDLLESVRQQNLGLTVDFQASLSESLSVVYRDLADLLLQQDRVLEAQSILDLLKVQELSEYLENVRGETGVGDLAYWAAEDKLLQLYDRAIQQGEELAALRRLARDGTLVAAQQERLEQLVTQEGELLESFDRFINHPDVVAAVDQLTRQARRQNLALEELNALQDNLRRLEQGAVLFYPLILEDRLELILVTPNSPPIRRSVPVKRAELNQAIFDFRRALNSPSRKKDAIAAAQKLHNWLIAPLAADLAAAGAETIIYAPDGQLRYVPLAALHDGEQWLAQNYRVNHITAASLTDLNSEPSQQPTVLAGAFTEGGFTVNIASRDFRFAGLPFAGIEVERLAQTIPQTISLVDQAFSLATLKLKMNNHSIVHLATHAAFVPGSPEDSFILFGNGDSATLRDIRTWNLSNVDLVVLSACQTALGGNLGNGEEILGFGYQMQRTGARAAIATLWTVDDGGTQALMDHFYQHLKQGMTKAEALQQAQVDLIEGRDSQQDGYYASPYYWAPFILIGNGL